MTTQELVERLRQQVEPVYDVAPYQTAVARAEMLIAAAMNLTAAADRLEELEAENALIEKLSADPVAVHINMLRGGIAKPSVANIIHLYGAGVLRAALEHQP